LNNKVECSVSTVRLELLSQRNVKQVLINRVLDFRWCTI
jgi:hypothetical protein